MIDSHVVVTLTCDRQVAGCHGAAPAQFWGQSKQEALQQAKDAGWRLYTEDRLAYCPACAKQIGKQLARARRVAA